MSASGFRIGALVSIPRAAISKRVRERSERAGYADVTPAQEVAMQNLAPEGMRLTALAARAGMPKQSMAYLVEQLDQVGYLERVPDPADARAKLIRRTERGWAYNRVAVEVVAEIEEEWADLIGQEAFTELKMHLTRLAEALGAEYRGSVAEASNPTDVAFRPDLAAEGGPRRLPGAAEFPGAPAPIGDVRSD